MRLYIVTVRSEVFFVVAKSKRRAVAYVMADEKCTKREIRCVYCERL